MLAVSRTPVGVERGRDVLYLPLDGTDFPLILRSRRPGDRFHPKGAPGSRKLKRFLIDERVPRSRRDRLALLCAGPEILWVAGIRPAEGARCPSPGELAWRLCAEPLEASTAAQ